MLCCHRCVDVAAAGSINTLSTKWADNTYSTGRDGSYATFQHPFLQAFGMFIGESLCLAAFFALNWRARRAGQEDKIERAAAGMPWYIFAAPATCDLMGTSLMYLGLTYTAASTFQMLRGSVVIFTGIFSVVFLGRTLRPFHWLGMVIVLCGLACVGISSIVFGSKSASATNPVLGDTLVVCAQLIAATQMVVEEKLLDKYRVPALQAVGMEGLFGMAFMGALLVVFQNIPGLPDSADPAHFEDSLDALHRLGNSPKIMVATLGNVCSIAWFNFFGLSVTKHMSATTRMVLDSIRTLVVWGVDLGLGWEQFQYLQIVGFALLLLGTAIYNKSATAKAPATRNPPRARTELGLDRADAL